MPFLLVLLLAPAVAASIVIDLATARQRRGWRDQASRTVSRQMGIFVVNPSAWTFGSIAIWASGSPWTRKTVFGKPGAPGCLPSAKWRSQSSSSRLVGVGREAADRADLALDLAHLAVELDHLRPGLEVGAERPLALVADEQQGRAGIADQVPEVAEDPAAGQHPVRRDDHVRPRGLGDLLRVVDVAGPGLVRVVERRVASVWSRRRVSSSKYSAWRR